jgi:hypothetical protein
MSVQVIGDDVYVVGTEENEVGLGEATLWVNGKRQKLNTGSYPSAQALSLVVKEIKK